MFSPIPQVKVSSESPCSLVILPVTNAVLCFHGHWAGGPCCQATKEQVYPIHSHPPPHHHLSENTALSSWCCFPEGTVIASVLSADVKCIASENPRASLPCAQDRNEKSGGCRDCCKWRSALLHLLADTAAMSPSPH